MLDASYVTLQVQFIAIIQILVYAGAIVVLFMFVVMPLNLGDETRLTDCVRWKQRVGIGLSLAFVMHVLYIVGCGENSRD